MSYSKKNYFLAAFLAAALLAAVPPAMTAAAEGEEANGFFRIVDSQTAARYFDRAVSLHKSGADVTGALGLFQSAIVSDSSLLLRADDGMMKELIGRYEDQANRRCRLSTYYKLGVLYDLTGNLDSAENMFSIALIMAKDSTIAVEISDRIKGLLREKAYYSSLASEDAKQMNRTIEEDAKKAAAEERLEAKEAAKMEAAERKRAEIADLEERIKSAAERIESGKKLLESQESEMRAAHNDWTGNTGFQREWRNTDSGEYVSDSGDPYQSTYRRRYRQAKKAVEETKASLKALEEEKVRLEKALDDLSKSE